MTIQRLAEPCRQCASPVYTRADAPGYATCAHCGMSYQLPAGFVVTPAPRRLHRTAWQIVGLLVAATAVLALAALGLALPPRVMLAVGIGGGLVVAGAGVWLMVGDLFDRRG